MKAINIIEIGEQKWNDFVLKSPNCFLYHKFYFASRLRYSFAVIDDNRNIVAICPLSVRSAKHKSGTKLVDWKNRILGKYKKKIVDTGYSGYAIMASGEKQYKKIEKFIIDKIEEIAKKESATAIQIRFDVVGNIKLKINPILKFGFFEIVKFQPRIALVLDLKKSLEILLAEMEEDCRSAIRKAERLGFLNEVSSSIEAAFEFFQVFGKTQKRIKKLKSYNADFDRFYAKYVDGLSATGNLKFILVKSKEGQVMSGVALHLFKNQAYYYRAGSDEQYLAHRVNNLALWNGIKFAKQTGYEFFNIGLIYPYKNPNAKNDELKEFLVGEFKKQFGKSFVPVFEGKKYLK